MCLAVVLKHIEFEFSITEILLENNLTYSSDKNKLVNDYHHSLPKMYYSDDLLDSFEKYKTHLLIFKKHLKNDTNELAQSTKRKRGRKQAPQQEFTELITKSYLEKYESGKKRFIEFCSPFKGSDMAYTCMAFQNLYFLPKNLNKKTLHKALEDEINIKMDYTGFTGKFKQENFQIYEKEISLKENELERIFSIK